MEPIHNDKVKEAMSMDDFDNVDTIDALESWTLDDFQDLIAEFDSVS